VHHTKIAPADENQDVVVLLHKPAYTKSPSVAFWSMLSKSLLAVGIRTEGADNTQMSCPTPNPKHQLRGLMPYSKHDGWLIHLSYLGPLSPSLFTSILSGGCPERSWPENRQGLPQGS